MQFTLTELGALATGLAALATAIITAIRQRRASAVAITLASKTEAETRQIQVGVDEKLWARVEDLRAKLTDHQQQLDVVKAELIWSREHERRCNARVAVLEELVPIGALVANIDDLGKVANVLDRVRWPFVISSNVGGGSFKWVNLAFADMLGMTRSAVILAGWQALVHPDDIDDTKVAEASAWDSSVDGFVNRFRHSTGRYRRLKWWASPYDLRGFSISAVDDLGFVDEEELRHEQ
jgi:PAS domain-containing protein